MIPAVYAPHSAFVAPARGSSEVSRLVIGILAVEFLFTVALGLFGRVLDLLAPDLADNVYYGSTPVGLIIQLGSFVFFVASLALVLHWQHRRRLLSALGPATRAAENLIQVFAAVGAFYIALELLPPWWSAETLAETRSLLAWGFAMPFGLAAILVQVTTEELFYRGYVQQQLAARFDQTWAWLVLPNVLFAAAHWDNGATGTDSWQYVIWAFCFGLAASDLTARTGNLGAAIGLHLANNAYAFLIYGEAGGPDSGLALFLFQPETVTSLTPPEAGPVFTLWLLMDIAIVWLSWLVARIVIRR
ncbi:lysostaphin resistance A-like protein [Pseudooceanicola sp. LIPI14-2-Ac024]|uniref:CPBP family intramembrane glutamic endopeptidase n=1 Tax=Pseudooceanicola sp. LIPI14-2-Ac024 TaxID=3344875 RepID=UPI0035CFDEDF